MTAPVRLSDALAEWLIDVERQALTDLHGAAAARAALDAAPPPRRYDQEATT